VVHSDWAAMGCGCGVGTGWACMIRPSNVMAIAGRSTTGGDWHVPDVPDTIAMGIKCPAGIAGRPLTTREAKMMQSNRVTMTNLLLMALASAVVLMGSPAAAEEEEVSMTVDEVVELIEPFGDGCTPKPLRGKPISSFIYHLS